MKFNLKVLPILLLPVSVLIILLSLDRSLTNAQLTGRFINNEWSGKCIDVSGAPGRSNGDSLQLWDCELSGINPDNGSRTDQQWILTNDGFIRNTFS